MAFRWRADDGPTLNGGRGRCPSGSAHESMDETYRNCAWRTENFTITDYCQFMTLSGSFRTALHAILKVCSSYGPKRSVILCLHCVPKLFQPKIAKL